MLNLAKRIVGLDKDENESLMQRYRILIMICGPIYAIWMLFFEHVFVPFYEHYTGQGDEVEMTRMMHELFEVGAIVAPIITLAIITAARVSRRIERNLYVYYQLMIYVMSIHYFLIVNESHLHKLMVMGTFVLIFSVSFMMATARSGAAYMLFVVGCSVFLVQNPGITNPKEFFILSQVTICLFALITIYDRRRLEVKDKYHIKELEEAKVELKKSEERTQFATESSGVSIFKIDADKQIITGSNFYYSQLGFKSSSCIQLSKFLDRVHPDDRQILMKRTEETLHKGDSLESEFRIIMPDGSIKWLLTRTIPKVEGKNTYYVGINIDITDKKIMEFKERESSERLELAMEAGRMGSWDYALKTGEITLSEYEKEIYGYDPDFKPSLESWQEHVHPEDKNIAVEKFQDALESGHDAWIAEYRIVHPEKGIRWVMELARLFRDKEGEPIRAIGITRDITESKIQDAELHKSALLLREAQRLAKLGSFELNLRTGETLVSDQTYDIYGLPHGTDLKSIDLKSLTHPDDKHIAEEARNKMKAFEEFDVKFRLIVNGKIKHIRSVGKPSTQTDGRFFRGFIQDITSEVKMAEENESQRQLLTHQSQLSALGEMAAGIAHEIFNPVAGIKLRASIIRRSLSKGKIPDDLDHVMGEVVSDVDRCTDIINGMKLLSRDPEKVPASAFKPMDVINYTLSLCRQRVSKLGIKVSVENGARGRELEAFGVPTMFSQVLLNLVNNAIDALGDLPQEHDKWIKIRLYPLPGYCAISVTDSGTGIPENLRDKIFQPFFTTKEPGKGTGLGLSISKTIMEKHGGMLKLESKTTNHTRFIMSMPTPENKRKTEEELKAS